MATLRRLVEKNIELDGITGTTTSDAIDLDGAEMLSIQAVIDVNTPSAKTFDSDRYEIQTLTYDTKANTTHQDFVIVQDAAGLTYAIALTKPVAEVQTVTFPDFATIVDRDYVVVYDAAGVSYAIYADKTGTSLAPTGAAYVAATHKAAANISAATTVTDVTDAFETAFNLLTGFTAAITSSGTVTLVLTQVVKGPVTNPVPMAFNDATAGTILGVQTTGGVASVAPAGVLWTAVASARKGLADISGDTTAAQVAARAETAWNLLTGFTAAITSDDAAANGTMTFTATAYGPVTNPVPKNAAESGAGSILGVQSTGGLSSEVTEGAGNSVTIPAHGYFTGLKGQLTTTGTLPAGLSLATDYFLIVVDASTVQFATSLALALAGTAEDITDEGVGVHTFTATALAGGAVKVQKSNSSLDMFALGTEIWDDVAAATAVTVDAHVWFEVDRPKYRWARLHYTLTAGSLGTDNYVLVKGSST